MKKKLIVLAMFLALVLVLTGCACKHEWVEATCTVAKTCSKCEEVEGEALGHTWVDATCEAPKTCSVCGETEGEALGHTWVDADCVTPKTCSVCAATEGEALGHTFVDADCVTPKTCSVCAATEGEALGHTWVDADCVTPKTCSVCAATEGEALGHTWVDADCVTPKTCSVCAATEGEALGHTWVDATCEAPKTCSVCAATEGEALGHTVSDWAVADSKLEKKCENCTYVEDSKELNLTSGVEMKAEVVNDSFVMLVPASMTTENVPADLVSPAAVYTAWDSETNTAIVVESVDAGQEMTTEETYEILSTKYSKKLVKNENGRDVIVILDDPVGIQLVMMDGANLTVIVLLHADMSPVETDGALLDIYMDIASNVFSK